MKRDRCDTLDFTYYTSNATYDLGAGVVTFANGTTEQILNLENVTAGNGNDMITGSAANNYLVGGKGNDTLNGGLDNDTLNGGDGDDVHNAGAGDDLLIGNIGADKYDGGGTATILSTSLTTQAMHR